MTKTPDNENFTGMLEVADALQVVIESCNPETRDALARTLTDCEKDCPDEFFFAMGPTAPAILMHLMGAIIDGCDPEKRNKADTARRRNIFKLAPLMRPSHPETKE